MLMSLVSKLRPALYSFQTEIVKKKNGNLHPCFSFMESMGNLLQLLLAHHPAKPDNYLPPPKSWAKSSEIARTPTQSLSWILFRSRTQIPPRWTSPWEKKTQQRWDGPPNAWTGNTTAPCPCHTCHPCILNLIYSALQNVIKNLSSAIHNTLHTHHLDCSLSNKPPAHLNMSLLGIHLCNSEVERPFTRVTLPSPGRSQSRGTLRKSRLADDGCIDACSRLIYLNGDGDGYSWWWCSWWLWCTCYFWSWYEWRHKYQHQQQTHVAVAATIFQYSS